MAKIIEGTKAVEVVLDGERYELINEFRRIAEFQRDSGLIGFAPLLSSIAMMHPPALLAGMARLSRRGDVARLETLKLDQTTMQEMQEAIVLCLTGASEAPAEAA